MSEGPVDNYYLNLKAVFESMSESVLLTDNNGIIILFNKKAGQNSTEILNKQLRVGADIFDFLRDESRDVFREKFNRVMAGESVQYYYPYAQTSNKTIWSQIYMNPVRDQNIQGVSITIRDVTVFKSVEEKYKLVFEQKIKESEEKYRSLIESSLDGILLTIKGGEILSANAAACTIFNMTEEELCNTDRGMIVDETDPRMELLIRERQRVGKARGELRFKRKDGSTFQGEISSAVFLDSNGIENTSMTIRDITEKKTIEEAKLKIEEQLLANKQQLDIIFNTVNDVIFMLTVEEDDKYKFLSVNKIFLQATGLTEGQVIGKYADEVIPSASWNLVVTNYNTAVKEKRQVTWEEKSEYPSGIKTGQVSIKPVFDDNGECIRLVGSVHDITDIKNAELQIRNSERRYRTLFEQNLAGVYQTTSTGRIINCNEAFAKMLKYESSEELLSINALELYFNNTDYNHFLQTIIDKKKVYNYESVLRCKDGSPLYVIENITVRKDEYSAENFFDGIMINITERKNAELQLQESHSKYKAIIDNSMNAFLLTNIQGDVLDVNETTCKLLGYSREEILKLNRKDLFDLGTPEYITATEMRQQTGVATGEVYGKRKNGELFPISFTTSIYKTAEGEERLSSIGVDISDKKKAEEKLLKSHERFVNLSRATFNAVWDWEVQRDQLYLGDGFKELFGYEVANNIGTFSAWSDHIHPDDKERVIQNRQDKILQHNELSWKDEYRYIRANGSIAYVTDRGILLKNNSGTYRMIGAMQDETDLKEHEIAITKLNQSLKKRAEELAVSNEELERFAYVTSHDLQEPLRMVTSFMQLLQQKYEGVLDDTAQKYINFAVEGSRRMKNLILDLLEFSRISSITGTHTLINVHDVITKTSQAFKTIIEETNASITIDTMPQVPGNESQLSQLFQNLIGNALKYRSGAAPVIRIGCTELGNEWQFFVSDNGIGIDQKFFEKIFVIFQRLHNKSEYSGTGIGLAICKKIVELHGGKIWVASSIGSGSTFYFTISKKPVVKINDLDLISRDITIP